MTDPLPTPFSVVITLQPPEAAERLTLSLQLYPSDSVPLTGGVAKPVRDCTLEELQGYADQLEAEWGALLAGITVGELVKNASVPVDVVADSANWLDQVVVIDRAEQPATVPPKAAEPERSAEAELDDAIAALAPVSSSAAVAEPPAAPPPPADGTQKHEPASAERPGASEPPATEKPAAEKPIAPPPAEKPTVAPPRPATTRTAGHLARAAYPRNSAAVILLDEQPLRQMQQHAASSLRREVAGFMLGPLPEKQPGGQYIVHVTDCLIADHTRMSGASVTYTPESWRDMHDRRLARYPDDDVVVVGWYHTHPGFGIFLSNMDLFIHQNFFTQKWHIAYVLDPVGIRSGFFAWDRAQSQVLPYPFAWPEWAANSW